MEKQMKPEESLSIIQSMIETEKMRINENGFLFLMWGYLVIAASLLQYLLMYLDFKQHYFAWFLMILGGVITGIHMSKRSKGNKALMPLSGKVMSYMWTVVGLNIFVVAFLLPVTFYDKLLFFILAMIGIATVISGALFRFRTMVLGGVICNLLAFASLFLPYDYWGAISILAVIAADLIPGYVLRAKYKSE